MAEQFPAAAGRRIRSSKADGGSLAASSLTSTFTDSISVRLGRGPGETKNWCVALWKSWRTLSLSRWHIQAKQNMHGSTSFKSFHRGGPTSLYGSKGFIAKIIPTRDPKQGGGVGGECLTMYDNVVNDDDDGDDDEVEEDDNVADNDVL